MHARAGAGEVGAVAFQAGLLVIARTVATTTAAAAGIGGADLPVGIKAQADTEVGGPGVDVAALLAAGDLFTVDGGGVEAVAVTGQPGHAAPVVDAVLVAPVVGVAVGLKAQPGQITGAGLVQLIDGLAWIFQVATVMGVVSAHADPMPRRPLGGNIAVDMQAILVLRGQLGEVSAVFAETLGNADVGA
ncbi:hypothetical protein D3C77_251900 [compost metagenome]